MIEVGGLTSKKNIFFTIRLSSGDGNGVSVLLKPRVVLNTVFLT